METNKKVICSSSAMRYAEVLFELALPKETIGKTREIFSEVPQITEILENPTIRQDKKEQVIDKVFPQEIRNFLKVVCRYQKIDLIEEIFDAYDLRTDEEEKIVRAVLFLHCISKRGAKTRHGVISLPEISCEEGIYRDTKRRFPDRRICSAGGKR